MLSWEDRSVPGIKDTHCGTPIHRDGKRTLCCCLQDFFDRYFPTREVFAALAPFILQVAPRYDREIQAYRAKRFRLYNIGIQIRRRKCNGDRKDLSCELRPSIESYCQVRHHQVTFTPPVRLSLTFHYSQ